MTDGVDEDTVEQRARLILSRRSFASNRLAALSRKPRSERRTLAWSPPLTRHKDATRFAGDLLFTILDDSEVVDTTVDEIDIGSIVVGQRASIVADAYPEVTLTGVVKSIAPSAISIGGLVTYGVRIELTTLVRASLDGMAVTAQIITDTYEDLVLVPVGCPSRSRQPARRTACAWTAPQSPESVQIGRSNGALHAEVLDGLAADDTVALVATSGTYLASPVRPPWARD